MSCLNLISALFFTHPLTEFYFILWKITPECSLKLNGDTVIFLCLLMGR